MMNNTDLAFDVNDPDFIDFLPVTGKAVMALQWTDFNVHDPGVTTLEAINFSMADLG